MKKRTRICIFLSLVFCLVISASSVYAEGSRELNNNDGYRAYIERNKLSTAGEKRKEVIYIYANEGETIYFGSSVANVTLGYNDEDLGLPTGTVVAEHLNDNDILLAEPNCNEGLDPYVNGVKDEKVHLYNVDSTTGKGYIESQSLEANGPNIGGVTNGYEPFSFVAPTSGIYTIKFYSAKLSDSNPGMVKAKDTWEQKDGYIAAWDATVTSAGGTVIPGRVFTNEIFLNMGNNITGNNNTPVLMSKVYVVTDDGYEYKVDFNGMDPFGFVFFANNRGLLQGMNKSASDGSYEYTYSLYHSVFSNNNALSDLADHNIILNNIPYSASDDHTFNIFFNRPDEDTLQELGIPAITSGNREIKNLRFIGTDSAEENVGIVGKGGLFKFEVADEMKATSYQLELTFTVNGQNVTRVLSNNIVKDGNQNPNQIYWDGKDSKGNIIPEGSYNTGNVKVTLKGGEVHFPLMDVEKNINGIKIARINGYGQSDLGANVELTEDHPDYTVYYNNSRETNIGDVSAPWSLQNWLAGEGKDESSGVSSENGAMKYTNINDNTKAHSLRGDGDQCALDIWTYYKAEATMEPITFELVEDKTTLEVTKVWDDNDNANGERPKSIQIQLYQDGDAYGEPVALNKAGAWSYKFEDIPAAHEYTVKEIAVKNYKVTYGNLKGDDIEGFKVTITNEHIDSNKTNTPTDGGSSDQKVTPTNTGDETNMAMYILLLLESIVLVVIVRDLRKN